ncbi:hypothetical protein KSP40_PGU020457 [Platanthera guangdongensis]|uniref:Uncharacterized protein n=1 Tax=Platanthera guangdongensis TaxID=2320717 RepID=A0ABR2MNK5_9ASPA
MSTIQVRFLIDREQRRVVFAEAGSDFVDLLFSFLLLPLGRIARLLSKQSALRSLSTLYESVEQLDAKYLQTEACRDMLLNPRSAAAVLCEALKIKGIHELNPRRFYTCSQEDCLIPVLEEQIIEFSMKKVLKLLERSFVSKNVLTEVCFPDFCLQTSGEFSLPCKEDLIADEAKNDRINLELILNKNDNKVLYAEVGDDFVNQLFSFLTFPLGSALKFLSNTTFSLDGCIQNLYSSVDGMSLHCFRFQILRNILLTPMLPTFYGIMNQMLKLEEMKSQTIKSFWSCTKCLSDNGYKSCAYSKCVQGIIETDYIEQNPKLPADTLGIMVLSLLIVMLTSKATLTDVFSPKPKPQWRSQNNYA